MAAKVDRPDPLLSVFPDLARRMTLCPRYIIQPDVMQASIDLSLGRPTVFREAMRHIRIPYPRMWFEWDESSREYLRQGKLAEPPDPLRPVPKRLGFLIESLEERLGTITWVWQSDELPPNVSPWVAVFDLNSTTPQPTFLEQGLGLAAFGKMWADNPVQYEALLDIWRTAVHHPSSWGEQFMQNLSVEYQRYLLSDVYGELIGVWALLLLITASRPTVEYRPVDRTKLNKARKGKTPLLDHTEITLHLNHRVVQQQQGPLGHSRKSPRLHMVKSYLGRRGDKHWLVSPYTRGSGRSIERHMRVTR